MRILKIFAKWFAIPLVEIFNESFKTRIFPSSRKNYRVCGVPKTTPCTLAEELRPISLTSVLAKLQESFAVKWMYEDIDGKISDFQYGGLPGSSAVYTLVNLVHKWYKATDESHRVVRIFLDFRKAFDQIDHNRLLETIRKIGVRPALVNWLAFYLNKIRFY